MRSPEVEGARTIVSTMNELVFEITEDDGGFVAECLTEAIFTQADSWEELRQNVLEAVAAFYFDAPSLPNARLHFVKNELLLAS